MSLRRSSMRPSRPVGLRRAVERLDDRIVPDTTGVTPTEPVTDPSAPVTQTTTTPPTDNGTSSVQSDGTQTTTTTTNGTTTTTTTPPAGNSTTTTTPPPTAGGLFAVGVDAGHAPQVRVMDPATGEVKTTLRPFNSAFRGGVRVATGDLTGDGVADIVAAAGPGSKATVKVYDGVTYQQLLSFEAYESFKGGVFVAVGDVSGDGRADLITGPGDGGGAHVKVFDGAGLFPANPEVVLLPVPGPNAFVYREFFSYDPTYRVGARVAAGDVDGDGKADVVTGTGQNGGPHVRVFSGHDGSVIREWMAYDTLFSGGVFVAAGDVTGDGKADVATGMGTNGIGEVKAFDGRTGRLIRSFVPTGSIVRASARVDVFDYDNDGDNDVVTSVLNKLNAYDGRTFTRTGGMTVFDAAYTGGVFFG